MMKTKEETLDWLYQQKKSKKREDLSRIKFCIEALDLLPTYKIIHIAGTNGKGSTASYISTMLESKGLKTGLFVSPFVIVFNERIEVNHAYISDEDMVRYCNELKNFASEYEEQAQDTIPFFELTFLMALKYFKDQRVEIAVIECGIGGLLDATNCLYPVVSVITNIGFDHMSQLGSTLEEIALQKLGITRPNVPCFTCITPNLKQVFTDYATMHHIEINYVLEDVKHITTDGRYTYFTLDDVPYKTSMPAAYQAYNASLAIRVMNYLFPEYPKSQIDACLLNTFWPGRFEYFTEQILLDGAHNLPGVMALKESLKQIYPNRKFKIIFTALKDKSYPEMVRTLEEITEMFYFTTLTDKRSTQVEEFSLLTSRPYKLYEHMEEALKEAMLHLNKEEILVITGSLHFISEMRRILKHEI